MNQAVTRSLVASLPRVVAIWLILAMIMGSLGGAVILSYKVGMETKDAIVIMKTHVQSNNYAEKIGLSQWIEENNVSQQIDAYWVQAYDTLMQQVVPSVAVSLLLGFGISVGILLCQVFSCNSIVVVGSHDCCSLWGLKLLSMNFVGRHFIFFLAMVGLSHVFCIMNFGVLQVDVFVEKNNLTEAAEVGKEFLRGASRKPTVIGAENETDAAALDIPSHPLVERLQDIKVSPPLTFHMCSVITVLLGIISFAVVEQNPIFVHHFSHKVQSYD
jgi:hypothetical protein